VKLTEDKKKALEEFAVGRRLYNMMRFREALPHFARGIQLEGKESPSGVYYARCKAYIDNPPPEDWDGVFEQKNK
jgi:hypothetical protein